MHWVCPEIECITRNMRSAVVSLSSVIIGMMISAASALAAQPVEAMAEIEAFGQTVVFQTPFRSFQKKRSAGSDSDIVRTQLTPEPDDPLYGHHSIEVVSLQGMALGELDASIIAANFNAQANAFCRNTPLQLSLPSDVEGMAFASTCAAQSHLGGDLVMVQGVFFGPRDLHVVIWTELVRPSANIALESPIWHQRVSSILPLHFCAPVPDNPKMLNCLSPKKVKAMRRQRVYTSAQ